MLKPNYDPPARYHSRDECSQAVAVLPLHVLLPTQPKNTKQSRTRNGAIDTLVSLVALFTGPHHFRFFGSIHYTNIIKWMCLLGGPGSVPSSILARFRHSTGSPIYRGSLLVCLPFPTSTLYPPEIIHVPFPFSHFHSALGSLGVRWSP